MTYAKLCTETNMLLAKNYELARIEFMYLSGDKDGIYGSYAEKADRKIYAIDKYPGVRVYQLNKKHSFVFPVVGYAQASAEELQHVKNEIYSEYVTELDPRHECVDHVFDENTKHEDLIWELVITLSN